jgi:hypothetical protein
MLHSLCIRGQARKVAEKFCVRALVVVRPRAGACHSRGKTPIVLTQRRFGRDHLAWRPKSEKARGIFSARHARTRSSLTRAKGEEEVRQIDFGDWGPGLLRLLQPTSVVSLDDGFEQYTRRIP